MYNDIFLWQWLSIFWHFVWKLSCLLQILFILFANVTVHLEQMGLKKQNGIIVVRITFS